MSTRRSAVLGLAMIALAAGGSVSRADLSLFGEYYSNVARAAAQNDAETVRRLVGGDTNPNQTDDQSRTGMHYAAMNGNLEIIAILVKARANLNVADSLGDTPLYVAADHNQTEAAKLLLDLGAEVDPQNKDGLTPLMIAANRGNLELVRALLAKGASPTKTDYTGRDALGWAQDSHRAAVIKAISRAESAKGS
ncbi:MAG TPA: ankyrin repeat domain-containing protein [Stellaceae bacterium]|nr:ankyrin repeat domain-containing protein [Stellaceae bacterium]